MQFDRYGRTYQLRLRTAEDLEHVLTLDDSLWVAMSAPISGLNCDREFLDFVDYDQNGRIRSDEVRAAVRWLFERVGDRSRLAEGADDLNLTALDVSRPEGQQLLETARYVLDKLGAQSSEAIGLSQIAAFETDLDSNVINGDGVIPPEAAEDAQVRQFVEDVMSCMGGEEDRTGQTGITEEALEQFLRQADAYLAWLAQAERAAGEGGRAVLSLGEGRLAAFGALRAVRDKIDEFFARCRMIRFNPAAADRLGTEAGEVEPSSMSDAESIDALLARLPVAEPNVEGSLRLDGPVNPAYGAALGELQSQVLGPILGRQVTQLSETQWEGLKAAFDPYEHWLAGKQGADVEELGQEKLRRYLDGPYADAVRGVLAADREVAERLSEVRALKKVLLYHKYLLKLANNFVSFPDLYDPARRAMFEMGSLVIDGRWFNFAVKVDDLKRHSGLAAASGMYVMYVELTRTDAAETVVVAVPATAGTVGNLGAGKRGVFYDTAGRPYDAWVIRIIENPISFGEALVSPFVRLGRFIRGKIEAVAGVAQKELESRVGRATQKVQAGVQEAVREAPRAAAPAPPASSSRRDILIGASLSIAALSSAFAFITTTVAGLLEKPLLLVLALAVVALVVFVPTALVAGFKLAGRDLSAILEGCGWAINARMRLNRSQRKQFTRQERYPAGAKGTPRGRWLVYILLLILLALCAIGAGKAWRAWGSAWWQAQKAEPPAALEQPVAPDTDAAETATGNGTTEESAAGD